MNFPLSVSRSKKMGDSVRQRKKCPTLAGNEPSTCGFDRPLLYRLSYKVRWEQVAGDHQGGTCSNVSFVYVHPGATV